jgi:hypothetical protein
MPIPDRISIFIGIETRSNCSYPKTDRRLKVAVLSVDMTPP